MPARSALLAAATSLDTARTGRAIATVTFGTTKSISQIFTIKVSQSMLGCNMALIIPVSQTSTNKHELSDFNLKVITMKVAKATYLWITEKMDIRAVIIDPKMETLRSLHQYQLLNDIKLCL